MTNFLEELATSVGAGVLVGSFFGGLASILSTRSLSASEQKALTGGYFGGVAGVLALGADMVVKSFV